LIVIILVVSFLSTKLISYFIYRKYGKRIFGKMFKKRHSQKSQEMKKDKNSKL